MDSSERGRETSKKRRGRPGIPANVRKKRKSEAQKLYSLCNKRVTMDEDVHNRWIALAELHGVSSKELAGMLVSAAEAGGSLSLSSTGPATSRDTANCNQGPNLDQAGARAKPKLFLISEDRLKILASCNQVCQKCEEIYETVEIKPSGTAACIQWSCPNGHGSEFCTQEMNNTRVGDAKSSTAGNISQEGTLMTSDVGLGDETTLCTTEEVHSVPVPKKTTSKKLVKGVKKRKRRKDVLVVKTSTADVTSGNSSRETETVIASDLELGFGDEMTSGTTEHEESFPAPKKATLEKLSETSKERSRSEDILVDQIPVIGESSDKLEMRESGSAVKTRDIQNEESECQTVQAKTEYNSNADNNVGHTQPEMIINSASAVKAQDDILNEVPDWHMVKVKIEPDSDSERDMEQSEGENTSGQFVRTNHGEESHLHQENELFQDNKVVDGKTVSKGVS